MFKLALEVDIVCLLFRPLCLFLFQSACVSNPCQNKGTCQAGFTDKGYRCLCTAGFKGRNCQKGEHASSWRRWTFNKLVFIGI